MAFLHALRCSTCGAARSRASRFCPTCGRAVTAQEGLGSPISIERVERRLFGVAPLPMLLVAFMGAFATALVLFALGHWPVGLVALVLAAMLAVPAAGGVKRHPENRVVLFVSRISREVRERAQFSAQATAAWWHANRDLARLRREVRALSSRREVELRALGGATYRRDEEEVEVARGRVAALEAEIADREQAAQRVIASANSRLDRARASLQPTEQLTRR